MGSVDLEINPAVEQQMVETVSVSNNSITDDLHAELHDFLDILKHLIRQPSVVGNEDAFFRILRRELEEVGVEVQHYHGVLVAQGNKPHDLFLSAHIDRHGLLCTGPNEFQYAAFIAANRGEVMGDSVSEYMINKIENRFAGQRVQAHIPFVGSYIGQGEITNSYVCPERGNLIFEVDGLEYLQPGTPVSFLDRLNIEDGLISAQLDNVVSAAMIIYLFQRGVPGHRHVYRAGRVWAKLALQFGGGGGGGGLGFSRKS